jgi:hypothetical protein
MPPGILIARRARGNWSFTNSTGGLSNCGCATPDRQRRLLASLADCGQQTPIVVVAAEQPDRYLVIDDYKGISGLQQLGKDTVEAVVWPMRESEALVLERSLRVGEHETALEQGWLLAGAPFRLRSGGTGEALR